MLKTVLSLAVLSTVYYQKKLIQRPIYLHHVDSVHNHYLQNSHLLKKPYAVTPWLTNPHAQIIFHTIKNQYSKKELAFRFETLTMPDGGITQLAWLDDNLPPDTPTILILHTITGSPESMHDMLRDLSQYTGWRLVLCLRRGHVNIPHMFSTINIMGSVPDLEFQIQHIQEKLPDSPLYAVGSSAGTALLARYLGDVGSDTPIKAAFAYAPGYDLKIAFDRVAAVYDFYMAKKVKKKFILPQQQHIQDLPYYQQVMKVKKLRDMPKVLYEFSGYSSYENYLDACNPILVFDNIKIPLMILNAEDDPICHIENARQYQHLIKENPYLLLITTKHGSHCIHYEGIKPRSWAHQLIAEYFLHQYPLDSAAKI